MEYRFRGLPSEHVLEPGGKQAGAYVYFGPQAPVASGHARLAEAVTRGGEPYATPTLDRVRTAARE